MKDYIYNIYGWNTKLFLAIHKITHHCNIFIQSFLYYLSKIFYFGNFTIYYLVLIFCFYIKFKNKNYVTQYNNYYTVFNEHCKYLLKLAVAYVFFILIYFSLKFVVNLPRPYCSLPSSEIYISVNLLKNERCLSSFPSAHVGLVTLIVSCMWRYVNIIARILCRLLICAVGISRIFLAMHYPSDLLYGCVISLIITCIVEHILSLSAVKEIRNSWISRVYDLFEGANKKM